MLLANPDRQHVNYVVKGFDVADLKKWRGQWEPGIPISVFTEKEFDLLRFAPSALHRMNQLRGLGFPIDKQDARRQYEVDLVGQYSVLETAVRRGYYGEAGFIDSKARALRKLVSMSGTSHWYTWYAEFPSGAKIDRMKGIPLPRELNAVFGYCPAFIGRISDRLKWVYELKCTLSGTLQRQPIIDRERTVVRRDDRRSRFGFADELRDIFGDNVGIVLYGSTTSDDDPNDYDTLVIVDDIPFDLYGRLESRVITWEDKPVDTVVVRRGEWESYIVKNPHSMDIVQNAIVVEGDVEFPPLERREAVLRNISRAVGRIRTLHGVAMNWAAANPDELVDREGLLVSLSKVPRYVTSGLWELKDLEGGLPYRSRSKGELESALGDIGVNQVKFCRNPNNVKEGLFRIMADTAVVVDKFHDPGWIGEYAGMIGTLNEHDQDFISRLERELERERHLQELWKLSELK